MFDRRFFALFFSCFHSLGRASSTFHIDLGILPLERGLRNRKRAKCACNPSKASDLFLFSTSGAEAPSTPFQATPSPTCHAWPYTVTAGTLCHRVFLETLEPYVLTGKLKTLSPEVLKAFVDRCQVRCAPHAFTSRSRPRPCPNFFIVTLVRATTGSCGGCRQLLCLTA